MVQGLREGLNQLLKEVERGGSAPRGEALDHSGS
jgi:hypothetical protein